MICQSFPPANTSINQSFPHQKLKIANSPKFFPARILRYTVSILAVMFRVLHLRYYIDCVAVAIIM